MSEQKTPLLQIGATRPRTPLVQAGPTLAERARLERRARLLAWGGIGWHVVEALIAVIAGVVAGSIALVGFGADSMIEAIAGFVVIWLFTGSRLGSSQAERVRGPQHRMFKPFAVGVSRRVSHFAATIVATDHTKWPSRRYQRPRA